MLTILELRRGAKNRHPTALCRCDCGATRVVRQTRVRTGSVTACAACSRAAGARRAKSRVAMLRAYGNGIHAPTAATFIRAVMTR